jgi:DNA-binding PadR family transcriptional regulator
MEKKGWIKCIINRTGRVYSLTEKGQQIAANMTDITKEIQGFIRTMLKSHNYTQPEQQIPQKFKQTKTPPKPELHQKGK